MAVQLFISEQYLKAKTIINENVDVKLILSTIEDAQRMHIEPALGTKLYEDLQAKIAAATLNADEKTLIDDYIAPALVKWVLFEASFTFLYKYTNKTIGKKNSENQQPTDYTEHRHTLDWWKDKAQYYTQRLIDYLCYNTDKFPNYLLNTDDDIRPDGTQYSTGMFLGNTKNRTNDWRKDYENNQ